ncbi:MAG: hypothetical protein AVDCRST_MAG47-1567 [uncultured Nocardioidaceae bacterium]|uniref:Uncharacterized protein n=1 Tax=uncultured Nocardioidaceae bacterium TaxID=253824 RepID=A0A6J4MZX4_9ACTN|nr:MAG: hypothetical protein AVDCRST_MAG47-1567 [uncultured Nocardioidaceae bacterium]
MTDGVPALGTASAALAEQLAITWHCAALLISPPRQRLLSQLDSVHRATHLLPDALGGPLRATIVHLERAPLGELEEEYRSTLDGSGLDPAEITGLSETLEAAASADAEAGRELVCGELPRLEKLRSRLLGAESGWAGAITAVTASLTQLPLSDAR